MENFTPVSSLIGGVLIGLSAVLLMAFNGRIVGISGILIGAMSPSRKDKAWRWWFLIGLLAGSGIYLWSVPLAFTPRIDFPMVFLILSGFMVGLGTRTGSGCTSGHGVCGLARLSKRSLVATLCFLLSGMLTIYFVRHILGVNL